MTTTSTTWSTYRPAIRHKGPTDKDGNPAHRLSDSLNTRKSLLGKRNRSAYRAHGQELIARYRANRAAEKANVEAPGN